MRERELRGRLADHRQEVARALELAAHLARPLACAQRLRRAAGKRREQSEVGLRRALAIEELEHAEGRLAERQRDRDEVAGLLDGLAVTSQGGGGRLA